MSGRHNGNGRPTNASGKQHAHRNGLRRRNQPAAPKDVDDEMLRALALDLRRDGASYRRIAEALTRQLRLDALVAIGVKRDDAPKLLDNAAAQRTAAQQSAIDSARSIGKDIAWRLVIEALTQMRKENTENADELRQIELERLDDYVDRLNANAERRADPRTVDTLLRVGESRRKLLGLDAEVSTRLRLIGADGGAVEIALLMRDAREAVRTKLNRLATAISAATPIVVADTPREKTA